MDIFLQNFIARKISSANALENTVLVALPYDARVCMIDCKTSNSFIMQIFEKFLVPNFRLGPGALGTDDKYIEASQHDAIAKQFVETDFDDLIVHMRSCAFADTYASRLQHQFKASFQYFQAHIVSSTLTFCAILFLATNLIASYV